MNTLYIITSKVRIKTNAFFSKHVIHFLTFLAFLRVSTSLRVFMRNRMSPDLNWIITSIWAFLKTEYVLKRLLMKTCRFFEIYGRWRFLTSMSLILIITWRFSLILISEEKIDWMKQKVIVLCEINDETIIKPFAHIFIELWRLFVIIVFVKCFIIVTFFSILIMGCLNYRNSIKIFLLFDWSIALFIIEDIIRSMTSMMALNIVSWT